MVSQQHEIKLLSLNSLRQISRSRVKMLHGSQDTNQEISDNSLWGFGFVAPDIEPICSETGAMLGWDMPEIAKVDITLHKTLVGKKVVSLGLAKPLWINCVLDDLDMIVPEIEKPRLGGENGVRFFLNSIDIEEILQMFSSRSKSKLMGCHADLQRLFEEVCKTHDCTILEGHRDKKRQDEAFRSGLSKLKFPQSKHNRYPALAVDVIPYPIDFSDVRRIYAFGWFVLDTAQKMGISIRWGGDWDGDGDTKDQKFNDLVHFELM